MTSVCMATFNGEKYIYSQIDSILLQISLNDEIIISDDSSTDNTINIIESFNDSRIKLLKNQTFYNATKNFENALKHAKGNIIFLSDQDDLWEENKVKLMQQELQTHDMVVCDAKIINEKNQILHESYFSIRKSRESVIKNILKNSYLGCCMAFKREILNDALPFPATIKYHDYWLGFIAGLFYKVKFLAIPLTSYRTHEKNVTTAAQNISNRSFWVKLSDRVCLLSNFPLLYARHLKKRKQLK